MRPPASRAVLAAVSLAFAALTGPVAAQDASAIRAEALRCAAGFGCMTQCEMLEALGLSNSQQAKDLYASERPGDYVRDVEALSGQAPEECAGQSTLAAGGSAGGSGESATQADAGDPTSQDRPAPPPVPAPDDFASWEGYSENSCPGTRLDDPRFVMQPSLGVLACFKGEDASFTECGMNPARAVCLMNGFSDVACYGVKQVKAAANVDAVCQNGSCPAFSYVVCR
ncbi:hypothetical protein [Hoeflea sp.]|uniref:hypothetical protein n=1 Tax=Hoeflea sp. TaxID=1940281 RepID=UPI003BAE2A97